MRDGAEFIDPMTRVMERLGERWTFLILREAFFGVRRFNQMQRDLGVSKNILAERLRMLVELKILRRHRYRRNPDFYEYRLTDRGLALYPAILAFGQWGDRYLATAGPSSLVLRHRTCGEIADPRVVCSNCGEEISARDIDVERGPAPG
jgi:DNA-binding HxlR family transcriptional regulator